MRGSSFLVVILICSVLFGGTAIEILPFGGQPDILMLEGERTTSYIDIEWTLETEPFLYSGVVAETDYIGIEGLESRTPPGHPQIPSVNIKRSLPKGIRIKGVELLDASYARLVGDFDIVPKPEQLPRSPEYRGVKPKYEKADVYDKDALYPACPVSAWGGSGRNGGVAIANLSPLLYNPVRKSAILMERARLRVYYEMRPKPLNRALRTLDTDAENIVIGEWDTQSSARILVDMHIRRDIPSVFVSVDSIIASYEPAVPTDDLRYRIEGHELPSDMFTSYDEDRALRIVAFLQDTDAHPNLRSVTLLGDSPNIPPSFYANFGYDYYYDDFMPSDFLYASPDFDLVPDYAVMRIPAESPCDASTMCPRFENYDLSVRAADLGNIFFAGGKPFDNIYFDDEMTPNHIINDGHVMGFDVEKSFVTRGGFTFDDFAEAWASGEYGFIYEMGHGDGFALSFDDGGVFGTEELTGIPPSSFSPIHFAGVCLNGLYDDELIHEITEEFTYAEAMMYAPGGAIALFSATRTSSGTPTYYFDDAQLMIETEEEIAAMGYYLVETYNTRPPEMGELMITTQERYIEEEHMGLEENIYCLYEFIGFGDPAMVLPRTSPDLMTSPLEVDYTPFEAAINGYAGYDETDPVFTPNNDSEGYLWGHARVNGSGYWYTDGDLEAGTSLTHEIPEFTELYRTDIEDEDGREQRFYYYLKGSEMVMDGRRSDWTGIPVATEDANDFEEEWLELTLLYVYDEGDHIYFGWPTYDTYGGHRAYCLAIDTKPGGFTGTPPYSRDAFNNKVTFTRGIDYQFAGSVYAFADWGWLSAGERMLEWTGDDFGRDRQSIVDFGGEASLNPGGGFMELRIPKSEIDYTDSLAVVLYTTALDWYGETYYPAQDAVPDNPEAFSSLSTGSNTLSEFYIFSGMAGITSAPNIPAALSISSHPNPFNSALHITAPKNATVTIHDTKGRMVADLGTSRLWSAGDDVASGVYILRAVVGDAVIDGKAVLIR